MPHLYIQLLGEFCLIYDGRPLTAINTTRLQSFLAYLLLHQDAPQPRRHLAFLFWPDTSEKQALTNLRTLYARLRQKLPDADLYVASDAQTIQWRLEGPFTLDVAAFITAVATAQTTADWHAAIALYRGPLLPHWYDEWLETERDRLQQQFFRAGDRLLQLLESQRDYEAAAHTAQLLLHQDPLHEGTYRRLMHVQALNGEKAAALRTYHTCAKLLEKELGVCWASNFRTNWGRTLLHTLVTWQHRFMDDLLAKEQRPFPKNQAGDHEPAPKLLAINLEPLSPLAYLSHRQTSNHWQ